MFKRIENNIDFAENEDKISNYWSDIDAFQKSLDIRKESKIFRFYDGPPFPTGSPHYGNLLAGVIKDIVPRYWTMRGYFVERRFGWDVHGLPIEMEVQKELGLEDPQDIDDYGIDKFNEACRSRYKRIQKTGKKLLVKLEDGSILKMIIKLWTLVLWRVSGGFSKNYLIKI